VIPFVFVLILPSPAIQFVQFDILAGSVYARTGIGAGQPPDHLRGLMKLWLL
jgi:hypothetical protein